MRLGKSKLKSCKEEIMTREIGGKFELVEERILY